MLNCVNINNTNYKANYADNQTRPNLQKQKNVHFGDGYYGYEDSNQNHPLVDGFLSIANDFLGITGISAALWAVQSFVNGKILSGKINKHFTKNIEGNEQLEGLADEMKNTLLKDKNVNVFTNVSGSEAFYTHLEMPESKIPANSVVVSKNQHSALFHELGHAVEENNTKFFKFLQRGRGKYAAIALTLYTLLAQREKPHEMYDDQHDGIGDKFNKFLNKTDAIVPLLAFSPELITEAKASSIGLKFLKEKLNANKIDKALYKNIKHSYITCFGTYLFIPVSIMLMDGLKNFVDKRLHKKQPEYYY